MKTNTIRTAIVTLAIVITTSVNAQNTKSIENSVAYKLSRIVKENFNGISNELNNLKAAIQYKPEANFDYSIETTETSSFDLSELESVTKYSPSEMIEVETVEANSDLTNALEEIKDLVKYQPQTDASDTENLIADITNELAPVVRYYPAS